jgi:hypothetical protein
MEYQEYRETGPWSGWGYLERGGFTALDGLTMGASASADGPACRDCGRPVQWFDQVWLRSVDVGPGGVSVVSLEPEQPAIHSRCRRRAAWRGIAVEFGRARADLALAGAPIVQRLAEVISTGLAGWTPLAAYWVRRVRRGGTATGALYVVEARRVGRRQWRRASVDWWTTVLDATPMVAVEATRDVVGQLAGWWFGAGRWWRAARAAVGRRRAWRAVRDSAHGAPLVAMDPADARPAAGPGDTATPTAG